jgi:hypothetical protein
LFEFACEVAILVNQTVDEREDVCVIQAIRNQFGVLAWNII